MTTLEKLVGACMDAGYAREDVVVLVEAINRQALRAHHCTFADTGEPFWFVEQPNAWPPQTCYLKDWPRLRFGVQPNPNFCGKCGHDSSQPDVDCTCVCHDLFAVILGAGEDDDLDELTDDPQEFCPACGDHLTIREARAATCPCGWQDAGTNQV